MSPVLAAHSASLHTIDPDIEHALLVFPSEIVRRARPSLRLLLGDPLHASGDLSPRGRLTGDGFPFELAFSTAAPDRLRFTVQPFGACDADRRLSELGRVFRSGEPEVGQVFGPGNPDVWDTLFGMQRGGAVTYGAWVGAQVDGARASFKVYAEVPRGGRMPAICPAAPVLPDRFAVPRIVGYTPSTGALESYFQIPSLEPEHLVGVLAPPGLALSGQSVVDRARAVLELVERAYGHRVRGRLPGASVGVSYTAHTDGRVVTLYFFARSIWGSDARIRRGFARLADERGWNADTYLRATEPLATREVWKTCHGLVGFTLGETHDSIAMSIGVRPIAPGSRS